jgi:hypothetical protein
MEKYPQAKVGEMIPFPASPPSDLICLLCWCSTKAHVIFSYKVLLTARPFDHWYPSVLESIYMPRHSWVSTVRLCLSSSL